MAKQTALWNLICKQRMKRKLGLLSNRPIRISGSIPTKMGNLNRNGSFTDAAWSIPAFAGNLDRKGSFTYAAWSIPASAGDLCRSF